MTKGRCDDCGGRSDMPPLRLCSDHDQHSRYADLAWRVCQAIEGDMNDRRGFKLSTLPNGTLDAIRETWHLIVRTEINRDNLP